MPIKSTYDKNTLLLIKELLDNGYTNNQIIHYIKKNISATIISNVRNGLYGPMPKFKSNKKMKRKLFTMNLEIIRNRKRQPQKQVQETNKT